MASPVYNAIDLTPEQCDEALDKLERFVMRRKDGCTLLNPRMAHVSGGRRSKKYSVTQESRWFKPRFRIRLNLPDGRKRFHPRRLSYAIAKGGNLAEGVTVTATCGRNLCIAPEHLRIVGGNDGIATV